MLTQIRERASGWLAWVIVVLITIPFALWGIQSYFENPTEAPVATVNGEEIPLYAYQRELSRRRQALQADGETDPALLESEALRARVLESMVANRLLSQYVREQKYRLPDALLRRHIETDPAFLSDGRFDPVLYRDLLRANGFTVQGYEASERQNAVIAQLASAVTGSAFATEPEVNRLLALQAETRKADYVIVPADRFAGEIEIDAAEVEAQYQDNLPDHQAPARIKADYIELSVDDLAATIEPTDAEIRETYAQTGERYKRAEIRRARHILFAVDPSADEAESAETLAAAEAVLAEARTGADFAELAQQHSDDPGSGGQGGDLGVVTRGQMVAPFEEAVFDMAEDEIRGPVETRFGYHLIQLTELTEERQKPLAEAREEVIEDTRHARAENLFAELAESFENLVFEDPESLATAAKGLGLEIKQTDWFTEDSGEGLAEDVRVRHVAFSEEVVTDGLNSPAIGLGFDRLVALRKAHYEAARPRTLEEVRDEIEARLKRRESIQKIRQLGADWVSRLNDGKSQWDALLQQEGLEAGALPEQRDQAFEEHAELTNAVFAHARPASGATVYGGISLGSGDYALYALREVAPGDSGDLDETQRARLRRQLQERDGGGLYLQLLGAIQRSADISIDRGQIENPAAGF